MRQRNWTLTKKALTEAYTLIRLCWSTFPRIELHLGGFAAATADQLAASAAMVPSSSDQRPGFPTEAAGRRGLIRLPVLCAPFDFWVRLVQTLAHFLTHRVFLLHFDCPAELAGAFA